MFDRTLHYCVIWLDAIPRSTPRVSSESGTNQRQKSGFANRMHTYRRKERATDVPHKSDNLLLLKKKIDNVRNRFFVVLSVKCRGRSKSCDSSIRDTMISNSAESWQSHEKIQYSVKDQWLSHLVTSLVPVSKMLNTRGKHVIRYEDDHGD